MNKNIRKREQILGEYFPQHDRTFQTNLSSEDRNFEVVLERVVSRHVADAHDLNLRVARENIFRFAQGMPPFPLGILNEQKPVHEKIVDPLERVLQETIAACCTIYAKFGQDEWIGSGFHLGGGLVVTAGHVAPQDKSQATIACSFDGHSSLQCQLITSEPDIDAAILFCPEAIDRFPAVKLGDSDTVGKGDLVAVIGAPEGYKDTGTTGRVSNVHQSVQNEQSAWDDIIFITAEIQQGASGGVCITSDGLAIGHVLGVTGEFAQYGNGEHAICPINKVKALISRLYQKSAEDPD